MITDAPTPLQACVLYTENAGSPFGDRLAVMAAEQYAAVTVCLSRMVEMLTNVNTITEQTEMELSEELRQAGRPDLAEAMACGIMKEKG